MAQCISRFRLAQPPQQVTRDTTPPLAGVTSWNRLPQDIQRYILDSLFHQYPRRRYIYAAVCREWRTFMEGRTFRNLTICQHGVMGLARLSAQPRAAIQHLWFNIELMDTNCRDCFAANIQPSPTFNRSVAPGPTTVPTPVPNPEHVLYQLFKILSFWDCTERGLTLEFNAHDVLEQAHWLKNWFIGCPGESHRIPVLTVDPRHDWRTVTVDDVAKAMDACFRPLSLTYDMKIPLADAVTKFVIRRYCRNRFRPSDIARLVNACPRLLHLHLETWAHSNASDIISQHPTNGGQEYDLIANIHPSTLRTLTESENTKQFAARSLDLEVLSVSFMTSAEDFFARCQSDWTWKNLQTIILTTRQFIHDMGSEVVSALLQDAARVALCMPRLETMVLWNASRMNHATSFTYHHRTKVATITWCSTVDLDFDNHTVQAWKEVARKQGQPYPYFWSEKRRIQRAEIISLGHAIRLLELPSQVIDPESRRQIEKEYEVPNIPAIHHTPL
ncbi:Oxoglutarate iron-dependent oxygenase [Fusarium mexicanum]|uniref:Oxoglutarate iron-dependent oxygenase n=1 Tax=Fusarium mexicanum TaxID=751941 RepID=A0A8H5JQB3_9HYPO|nr:Oxoglutarate iron-dependent oxygenase [Fusarium mexicanum]